MGVATAASRALGGVRVLVVAAVLGTTFLGNTFEAANTLPTVLFELLAAGALSAVLVPSFSTRFDRGEDASVERLAGGVLGVALVVLGAVAIAGVVGAPWLAAVLTSAAPTAAVEAGQRELATFLLRFFMPQVAIYAVGFLAIAVLNARRVFSLPAAAPIANTVVVVAAMVAFRQLAGPDPGLDLGLAEKVTLGLGGTLGVLAFVSVPAFALARSGFRLRPRLPLGDPEVRSLVRLSALRRRPSSRSRRSSSASRDLRSSLSRTRTSWRPAGWSCSNRRRTTRFERGCSSNAGESASVSATRSRRGRTPLLPLSTSMSAGGRSRSRGSPCRANRGCVGLRPDGRRPP